MKRKKVIAAAVVVLLILVAVPGVYVYRTIASISEMFRLNGQLQAEGYYMGEFEFKMLGCAYYLDKGQYLTALNRLNELHRQLKTREGLIKVPPFADKREEMEFYLSLQNPRTGAFMDDSYPVVFYLEPTENVIDHLEILAQETGQPLHLKYPLRFLDEISTPDQLRGVLDDVSTVGWIGARLPKTNYLLSCCYLSYDELERKNLYTFSPEWKQALLQWFYDNQDSRTGFWGPRLRPSGELLDLGDISPTYKLVKFFVDEQGSNRFPGFPLRYQDQMLATTLQKLDEPMPEDADLAEIHDWNLTRYHGLKLLTKYLWNGVSAENKNLARTFMEGIVRNKFEKFYIESQGAFGYYPGSKEATLDGTGDAASLLDVVGAFSRERQEGLWGRDITDLGTIAASGAGEIDLAALRNSPGINSIRFYRADPGPGDFTTGVVCVYYPRETRVLDVMDLVPRMKNWVNATPQNMGNWTSKEAVIQELEAVRAVPVPVYRGDLPQSPLDQVLRKDRRLVVVGFDVLQVPRERLVYVLRE